MEFWNPRRRRSIRWLAPLWLAVAVAAVLLLGRLADNRAGRAAYDRDDPQTAHQHFERTNRGNVVEPWVAAYNRGTSRHRMRRYAEAADDFGAALRTVPAERDCLVRVNLVAAREALADELSGAGRHAEAARAYADALGVLRAGRCGDRGGAEERRRAEESRERIERKRQQAERKGGGNEPSARPSSSPRPEPGSEEAERRRAEEVRNRGRQGQQEAQEGRDRERRETRTGAGVDRPW